MSLPSFKSIETVRFEAEVALADYLLESNIISESSYKMNYIGSGESALFENASRSNAPGYWYGKEYRIHYTDFKNVWNNVRDYPSLEDVYMSFHGDKTVTPNSAKGWARRALNSFLGSGERKDPGVPEARKELIATTVEGRAEHERKLRSGEIDNIADEFTPDMSIDGGYGRRGGSRTKNIETASTLFSGEVYNDISRIPPRRWGSWWKRFTRRQTSVPDKESGLLSLRKWTKHFIMGYQIDRGLFFEIWYNSYDSTFAVHDRYGNAVRQGDGIPLIRDALNTMFHNVADYSPQDAEILQRRGPDLRRVNMGLEQALSQSVNGARSEAERMRERKERIEAAAKQKADDARSQRHQKDRQAAEDRGRRERQNEKNTDREIGKSLRDAARGVKGAAQGIAKTAKSAIAAANKRAEENEAYWTKIRSDFNGSQGGMDRRSINAEIVKMDQERLKKQGEAKSALDELNKEIQRIKSSASAPENLIKDLEREYQEMSKELKAFNQKESDFIKSLDAQIKEIERKKAEAEKETSNTSVTPDLSDMGIKDAAKKQAKSQKVTKGKSAVNENIDIDQLMQDASSVDLDDYDSNPLYHTQMNQQVERVRSNSKASPYTRQLINAMFIDGFVKVYDETRVRDNRGFFRRMFDQLRMFRGRPSPIALPTTKMPAALRAKGFIGGAQARADFIIGYSINDVVNFEIWYVQEISRDGKNQLASFHLYDVTASKVLERNIPHYRNAVQLLMLKIGSEDTGA